MYACTYISHYKLQRTHWSKGESERGYLPRMDLSLLRDYLKDILRSYKHKGMKR